MSKKLLYLFALICSIGLFTACSDDDEDNSWQQLPQGELTADKVSIKLNGEPATGTIEFKALSLESAQVTIKNVIDGYSSIAVDAVMEKQTDGSFKLTGKQDVTTKPVTKQAATSTPFLSVNLDGSITTDGLLTLDITASGTGLYIRTYSGDTFLLKYGDDILGGKTAVLDATDGDKVTILLSDVIPGDAQTTLSDIQISNDTFSGSANATYGKVEYTGSIKNKVLSLNLNVTMNDPKGWAKTYHLAEYTTGELEYNGYKNPNTVLAGAGYVNYVCVTTSSDYGTSYGVMLRGIFGVLLPQVLHSVTLEADGNITAEYMNGKGVTFEPGWALQAPTADVAKGLIPASGWLSAPHHLAYWFEKDGKLYTKLNIEAIITQVTGTNMEGISDIITQLLTGDPATLKALLAGLLEVDELPISDATIKMLQSWAIDGIPMTVKTAEGHTYMYLDKATFDPIMKINESGTSDILAIWDMLGKAGIIPAEAQMAGMLLNTISANWSATEEFELGLDLQ
ncbi:MAG: DUF4925 domain-containing protein [Parabacteroides sp.]|nr:DUF4925 domain-containing protein [Parabacteroides sp.]